ncbi:DUF456 domain-containing protein [Desulfovibrio sp. OttesenSCG-928-M14]|nr:DUF456 domain-containing protein [Desulfovibrio sp. OttesenSCG-928-M14]MDL2291429.1 DUF456 domain-containing protein [Desulfovibrio sp. OttesenSCG-928-F20]
MLYLAAGICTLLMLLSLTLIFFGLPGTWLILGISAVWSFFADAAFGWQFFALLALLAGMGEVLEFGAGYLGARKFGGSSKGSLGGIIGAIAGAIVMAPLFFGLGALAGALLGGFTGCFIVEKGCGASTQEAARAAFGATLGRFGGFVIKLGIGVGMIWIIVPRMWTGL